MVCQHICEQWESDRQQTRINNRLIGPAGGSGTPTDSREDRKIREMEEDDAEGCYSLSLFFVVSLNKQVKEKKSKLRVEIEMLSADFLFFFFLFVLHRSRLAPNASEQIF